MGVRRKRIVQCVGMVLVLFLCGRFIACVPKERTKIRFWHSYTGAHAVALQKVVAEYNRTVGKDRGVEVIAYYKGSLQELSEDLNTLDKQKLPNIIEVTNESAYMAYLNNRIVSAQTYLSEDALSQYASGFLNSGRFTSGGGIYIFPLQAKLDVLYLNGSLFDAFRKAYPEVQMGDLQTWDRLYAVAEKYYEWSRGKSFLAIEDIGRYLMTVSHQYGTSIAQTGNRGVQIVLNYEVLREIWDFFYAGTLRGYISLSESSLNYQMQETQLMCYLASSASAKWVPSTYTEADGTEQALSLHVKQYPTVHSGRGIVPHEVEGVAVVHIQEELDQEAYTFLDWLCKNVNVYEFCIEGKAVPVHETVLKNPQVHQNLLEYISGGQKTAISLTYGEAYTQAAGLDTYSPTVFYGSEDFSEAVSESLIRFAKEGHNCLQEQMESGMSYTQALAYAEQETFFQAWIQELEAIQSRY